MSDIAWSGVFAVVVGLVFLLQRRQLSRFSHEWDKRLSPEFAPLVRVSPRAVGMVGVLFVLLGAATVIYALLTHP